MEKSRWNVTNDKLTYNLKPITHQKTIRSTKSRVRKTTKITFSEKRMHNSSFVSSTKGVKAIEEFSKTNYDWDKYTLVPIIKEIKKNRITELLTGLKTMAVDIQEFITTEAEIIKRHNTNLLKNQNFK